MFKKKIPIVDIHSHILPGVDHGSASCEMSVIMMQQARNAGVTAIAATPHFYPHIHTVEDFLRKRETGISQLKEHCSKNGVSMLDLLSGAEVALEQGVAKTEHLSELSLGESDHILIEMPMFEPWQSWMVDELYDIQVSHQLRVVLAHIDRYPIEAVRRLLDYGFLAQINAEALVHGKNKHYYQALCRNGLVQFLGSDAHDAIHRNYYDTHRAQRRLNRDLLTYFYENSLDIINMV